MENPSLQIDVQLNELKQKLIEKNRAKLRPMVDAVVLCGRQTFALPGHRDESKDQDSVDNNAENFIEILKFGANPRVLQTPNILPVLLAMQRISPRLPRTN